jgi:multicomponent Na+:H+ antiporter subunit F
VILASAELVHQIDYPALGAGLALLVGMVLLVLRAVGGPTAYDRILAMNAMGTKAVMLIALIGFMTRRPDVILDFSLAYAILNFLATIAILRYAKDRRLG